MDGFLLVVPFLGDFYISCHIGGIFSNLLMSWFYRGLLLLVIVEAFGMLYWGIFPFGHFFQS